MTTHTPEISPEVQKLITSIRGLDYRSDFYWSKEQCAKTIQSFADAVRNQALEKCVGAAHKYFGCDEEDDPDVKNFVSVIRAMKKGTGE